MSNLFRVGLGFFLGAIFLGGVGAGCLGLDLLIDAASRLHP